MRVLFSEPPKSFWFVTGDCISPPLGILTLAGYLEPRCENVDVEAVDSQAEKLDWEGLEKRFGEPYQEYKRTTPSLIPRTKPLILDLFSPLLKLQQDVEGKNLNRYRLLSFAYVGISLLGLCLLALLASNIPMSLTSLACQKQMTFMGFGAICILGAIAGIYPSRCSRTRHFGTLSKSLSEISRKNAEEAAIIFRGHHPTCGNFASHVLQFRGKTYCAGCGGLVTGAIASIFGVVAYLLGGLNAGEARGPVFWLGFLWVACGLLQYGLPVRRGAVHFSLNVLFVLGAFLLLIGINETNSIGLDLYFLTLTVYWIIARMMVSRLEHRKICAACGQRSCHYSFG